MGAANYQQPAVSDRLSAIILTAPLVWLLVIIVGCNGKAEPVAPATQAASSADRVRIAERGPVKLRVEVDKAALTIPEQLMLTVTVESGIGVDVVLPEPVETLGGFGVAAVADAAPVEDAFTIRQQRVYTLDSFLSGDQVVPPVVVSFADRREKADGSRTVYEDVVQTEPIPITVNPGMADVKGPVMVPMPGWQRVLLWTIGVIAAMVGIALLARWWRQRRRDAERELPWAMRVSAHQWALAELDKLAAENLVGKGQVQTFYYRINGLLRRYIELRFDLMAGEQTSEEFIRALQDAAHFDEHHKEVLRRFVLACDPVKYARHQPTPDEIDWVQASARDFVLETAENAPARGNAPASNTSPTMVGGDRLNDSVTAPRLRPGALVDTSRARPGAPSGSREDVT